MSQALQFLTQEYLQRRYGSREEAVRPPGVHGPTKRPRAGEKRADQGGELHPFVAGCLDRAQVARAWGASPDELRAIWRAGAVAFEPALPELDFAPVQHAEDPVTRKRADALTAALAADVQPGAEGRSSLRATYVAVPQPQRDAFYSALLCVVLAHDWSLADGLARGYLTRPAETLVDDYYGHKTGLLRELVLGNDEAARAHLEALPRRYMADPPPDRLELAEAILNGDEAMLREGIRKIGTRFAANWNPRKHEEWARKHHKQLSVVMDASRGALIALHWVLSEWGVACASLAVHRGLTGLLADARLWSEWLPRSLCADRPLPDEEPKSRPRGAGKPRPARPASPSAKPVPGPGPTPLHEAVEEEDHEKLASLIAAGADLEARDHKALTPLLRAVRDDNLAAVRLLLQAGADPNAVDDLERGALHFLAVRGASVDVARELLAQGADVDLRLDDGTRPLQIVSTPQMAEVLLDAGAEIDARNDHGTTALCRLIRDGKTDLALLLIARGADPGIARNDGHTPLHEACKKTSSEVVAALLDHGAEVNGMTPYGIGPLHLAAGMRQREIVALLLQRGADVNLRQPDVPEDFAQYVRDLGLTLLYTGGDQRKRQYNLAPGSTPLHFAAAARSNADVVQLLLDNGADPSVQDASGRTALDWAREYKDSRTVKLLERYA